MAWAKPPFTGLLLVMLRLVAFACAVRFWRGLPRFASEVEPWCTASSALLRCIGASWCRGAGEASAVPSAAVAEASSQTTGARSCQPLVNAGTCVRAATESGNLDSIYARLRAANGLGPPPR
jgi:hypothetical protein